MHSLTHTLTRCYSAGDNWRYFLSVTADLCVIDWQRNDCYALSSSGKVRTDLSDIKLAPDGTSSIQKIIASTKAIMSCASGTATRGAEVDRVEVLHMSIKNGMLYIAVVPEKRGSVTANDIAPTYRIVPPSCVGMVLLLRRAIQLLGIATPNDQLFPEPKDRDIGVVWFVKQVFGTDPMQKVTLSDTRQLVHTKCNIMFPHLRDIGQVEKLTSVAEVSELSNHTQATAKAHYGTELLGSVESIIEDVWTAWGESDARPKLHLVRPEKISDDGILDILRLVYGPQSSFRNETQRRQLHHVLSNVQEHHVCLNEAGGGKTAAPICQVVYDRIRHTVRRMVIVVVPSTSLAGHLRTQIEASLETVKRDFFSVMIYTRASLSRAIFPHEFKSKDGESLPDVAVMTIDAFASLVTDYIICLRYLADKGLISGIYLDEVQQLPQEKPFRDAWDKVSQYLGTIGVRIFLLSGTLTASMAIDLAGSMGLRGPNRDRHIDVIMPDRLSSGPGHDIHLSICPVDDVDKGIAEFVSDSLLATTGRHIHVMCDSVVTAVELGRVIEGQVQTGVIVRVITGDTSQSKKIDLGRDWALGKVHVLVTTTCHTFGNSNILCKTVIVRNHLHTMANMIQAMKRIRMEHTQSSRFVVFLPTTWKTQIQKTKEKSENLVDGMFSQGLFVDTPRDSVLKLFTLHGVYSWMAEGSCLQKGVHRVLGHNLDKDCGLCTVCDNQPLPLEHVSDELSLAATLVALSSPIRGKAPPVLDQPEGPPADLDTAHSTVRPAPRVPLASGGGGVHSGCKESRERVHSTHGNSVCGDDIARGKQHLPSNADSIEVQPPPSTQRTRQAALPPAVHKPHSHPSSATIAAPTGSTLASALHASPAEDNRPTAGERRASHHVVAPTNSPRKRTNVRQDVVFSSSQDTHVGPLPPSTSSRSAHYLQGPPQISRSCPAQEYWRHPVCGSSAKCPPTCAHPFTSGHQSHQSGVPYGGQRWTYPAPPPPMLRSPSTPSGRLFACQVFS